MLFAKRFNNLMIVLFLIFPTITLGSHFVTKYEGQCGELEFLIKIVHDLSTRESQFICYYETKDHKKKVFYKPAVDAGLHIACIQNNKKEDMVFLSESYGGNTGPEDIYGIFDPKIRKMLIKPSDWPQGNSTQIQKILGYLPTYSYIEKNGFCCLGWRVKYLDYIEKHKLKNW